MEVLILHRRRGDGGMRKVISESWDDERREGYHGTRRRPVDVLKT